MHMFGLYEATVLSAIASLLRGPHFGGVRCWISILSSLRYRIDGSHYEILVLERKSESLASIANETSPGLSTG